MEELVDLIATDASASDVSDSIKASLMAKAAARIDAFRPEVSNEVFGDTMTDEIPEAEYDETSDEYDEDDYDEDDYEEESTEEDYE